MPGASNLEFMPHARDFPRVRPSAANDNALWGYRSVNRVMHPSMVEGFAAPNDARENHVTFSPAASQNVSELQKSA